MDRNGTMCISALVDEPLWWSVHKDLILERHTDTSDREQLLRACHGKKRTTLSRTAQLGLSREQQPKYSLGRKVKMLR